MALITPLAQPRIAGLVALIVYLGRALLADTGLPYTEFAYFNFLADAFLHGQLNLRLPTPNDGDLVPYADKIYLYWPPFPAIVIAPLVALFGVAVSDVAYTAVFAAITIALLAKLLVALDATGLAPLTVERRAILVGACAFGSVLLILAPVGRVWFTAQIIGWGCVLLATLAALTRQGKTGYFLVGLALACATTTRISLLFNGVWLAYYLLHRDRQQPLRQRVLAALCGLTPVVVALGLFAAYNTARFGNPLEMGVAWHNLNPNFAAHFARYGVFNLHYLPTNLYYQFVAYTILPPKCWFGGGIFWMTPVLLGAPYGIWQGRRNRLVWALVLSGALVYIPIGLLMGTGWVTYGPRYLLDLMVPLVVLTALGIREWRLDVLRVLMYVSIATYAFGSWLWFSHARSGWL